MRRKKHKNDGKLSRARLRYDAGHTNYCRAFDKSCPWCFPRHPREAARANDLREIRDYREAN